MGENIKQIQDMLQLMIEEGNGFISEYKGYKYEIIRVSHSGHLCGYIYMDKATDKEFEIMESNFHGGVTWGFGIEPQDGKYGFDCAHAWDLSPFDLFTGLYTGGKYRTMDYVEECLKNTIDLLVESKK